MKLSEKTSDILKNFSSINQSILIREGNVLKTISPMKNIMSRAEVEESFPKEFAIYNLNQFINVLDLFKEDPSGPELIFEESFCAMKDSTDQIVHYFYASPNLVAAAPEKDITLPSVDLEFDLPNSTLQRVLKAALIMGLPNIVIQGDGSDLFVRAVDTKNSSSNDFSIRLGDTDVTCSVEFKTENFKMIEDDYKVSISSKKISCFEGKTGITYWVAAEASSTFE